MTGSLASRAAVRGLCADLGLGDDPQVVLTAVSQFYRWLDERIAHGTSGLDLPCRAGCDACCHEAVFVSAPEFLAVAAYLIEHRSREQREAIVAAMVRHAVHFEDELLLLDELPAGAERDEVARRVRFRCPLLEPTGACSVYPVRELNARTFGTSHDELRGHPYGCELTHDALRVLPSSAKAGLTGARAARHRFRDDVPGVGDVYVYPWWFQRFGRWILAD